MCHLQYEHSKVAILVFRISLVSIDLLFDSVEHVTISIIKSLQVS